MQLTQVSACVSDSLHVRIPEGSSRHLQDGPESAYARYHRSVRMSIEQKFRYDKLIVPEKSLAVNRRL